MRIRETDYETTLTRALTKKLEMAEGIEHHLFAEAEKLLAKRRALISEREAGAHQRSQAGQRWLNLFKKFSGQALELFALHPNTPATAAILATLFISFFISHNRSERIVRLSYADLPALSKNNDAPARYDAQILAERQTYEREVEDAHQKTSGGL